MKYVLCILKGSTPYRMLSGSFAKISPVLSGGHEYRAEGGRNRKWMGC